MQVSLPTHRPLLQPKPITCPRPPVAMRAAAATQPIICPPYGSPLNRNVGAAADARAAALRVAAA